MSWATTAAITAIVSAVGSAATAIIGNEKATDAANDAAFANKQRLDAEARNRELEAAEAIKRQRLRDKREKAALRARLAQSGSLTTSGTPLLILGDTAASMELAIQDTVRAANADASSLRAQGTMGIWEASAAGAARTNDSIGTAVGAVGDAATSYTKGVYKGTIPDTFGLYPRTKRTA